VELHEIVVQGLRGFPQMTRFSFGSGATVVHPLSGHEQALSAAVVGLLYPEALGDTDPLAAMLDPSAEIARVDILVRGRDGVAYRVLRDLRAEKWSLLKEAKGGFSPLSSRPGDISQAVTATLGFPQSDVFRDLFVTRKGDLPSQQPEAQYGALPPDAGGPMALMAGRPAGSEFALLSEEERRAKLQSIEQALAHNQAIRDIEFEIDGFQRQVFELDAELGHIDGFKQAFERAEKALREWARFEGVDDGFSQRAERLKARVEQGKRDLERIKHERGRLDVQLAREMAAATNKVALLKEAFKDRLILGGTAFGLASIALGVVGAFTFEGLRYLAFGDVIGFGVALFGAWRFIGEAEESTQVQNRIARLEEDRAQKAAKREDDEALLDKMFADIGYAKEDILRVEDILQKRAAARQDREAARAELAKVLADPALAEKERRRVELTARVAASEDRLHATGGYMGDGNELRQKAAELRDLLAGRIPEPSLAAGQAYGVAMPAPAGPDLTARLLARARDILLSDVDTLCQALQPRVAQYLGGLSDRRYGHVLFGPRGEMTVVETASGRAIPFGQLPPGDRDVAYLSLKLTIAEASVRRGRLPIVLERAFDTLSESKDPLLVKMVQFLATATQVVCMTARPGLLAAGEHRISLS
jgi:hypothetical protein